MNTHINIINDDDSLSSGDDDGNQLGETLVRAQKFIGGIVRGGRVVGGGIMGIDSDDGGGAEEKLNNIVHEQRYEEANNVNLYTMSRKMHRSVRNVDGYGDQGVDVGLSEDELSVSSEESRTSFDLSKVMIGDDDKWRGGDKNDNDGVDDSGLGGAVDDGDADAGIYLPPQQRQASINRQKSDVSSYSITSATDSSPNSSQLLGARKAASRIMSSINLGNKNVIFEDDHTRDIHSRRSSTNSEESTVGRRNAASRIMSSINLGSINLGDKGVIFEDERTRNIHSRRSSTNSEESAGGRRNAASRLMSSINLGNKQVPSEDESTKNLNSRRSSMNSEDTSFGDDTGGRRRRLSISNSFTTNRLISKSTSNSNFPLSGSFTVGKSPSNTSLDNLDDSNRGNDVFPNINDTSKNDAKERASAVKRNVNVVKHNISLTAGDTTSFRELQKRMKEKGAVTGNAVRALLKETVEEHLTEEDVDTILDKTLKVSSGGTSTMAVPGSTSDTKPNLALKYLRIGSSNPNDDIHQEEEQQQQQLELNHRLEKDPMFGLSNPRPYVGIPSHEGHFQLIRDVMGCAVDQGEASFISVHGGRFTGKSKLINHVIDSVQSEGMEFTALWSYRSDIDALTSFYPFREIISAALKKCDSITHRSDSTVDPDDGLEEGANSDNVIVQRLIRRKILNKSDQLMIGRILPEVMNNELLSLLKGRNPTAMIKDLVDSLLKIMIPLQPVMLVFEADGDGDDIDSSSLCLMEELLLAARKQCPQMIMVALSRKQLDIPKGLLEMTVSVHMKKMEKDDMEGYIRALFCDPNSIDRNMRTDLDVIDGVYERTRGCPLFTERAILWAIRKKMIEIDETRNAVSLNLANRNESVPVADILPVELNEEILEVINNLPHEEFDALKVACCLGTTFHVEKFEALRYEGFYESLLSVIASHGIFEKHDDGCYKWKHHAVFEAVESIIISNERVEIHGRIAASLNPLTLEHVKGDAQFARHYAMADRWDEALSQYMDAGKKAEKNLDFMGAENMYKQAEICLQKFETTPSLQQLLSPRISRGWCLRELVRYQDAEDELEHCLKAVLDVPEEDQKSVEYKDTYLQVITALATLKQAQSKYREAMELYERALPIARENQESHSRVWLANHVATYAEILRKGGNLAKAETLHSEALGYRSLAVELGTCTILELAMSFTQLGCTLSGLGDFSKAYNLHKKALAARVEHLDFHHSLVSESLNYCADALQALERGKEGIPLGMHAVQIRQHVFGPRHPAYAHALSVLASCYHSTGRSFDALELLEECLEICEIVFSKNHANLIPNLINFGNALRVTGDINKARSMYERALSIHSMNFGKENMKRKKGIETELIELTNASRLQRKSTLDMPIPPIQPESGKEHVIVCADIGRRASDEYMLSVAASLEQMGMLKLIAVVAVSPPQVERADIARGALDSLLLSDVPVAFSGVTSSDGTDSAIFQAEYGKPSPHVNNTGVELILRTLTTAPDKSLVLMCTACLGDVSEVIDTNPDLFSSKVKEVIILGSVKPFKRSCSVEPEDSGIALNDSFAKKVYRKCQEMKIPTLSLCPDIVRGFPFPSKYVDELTVSNHMVGLKIKQAEEMHMNGNWEAIKQNKCKQKAQAKDVRSRKALDNKSFCKYSLGNQNPQAGQVSIWSLVKSIDIELTLGLMSCLPAYRDAHFRWETHKINGICHKACRQTNATSGMMNLESLANEIQMLIGFTFRTSLLNTSC